MERSPLDVSSEQFLELANDVVAECAAYLEALPDRAVFPETSGVLTTQQFGGAFPEQGIGRQALAALREVAAHSRALNGRAAAYVLGSENRWRRSAISSPASSTRTSPPGAPALRR